MSKVGPIGFVAAGAFAALVYSTGAHAQVTFPGLVHRWSANGSLADTVGGANGTAVGNVSFVPGVFGQAMQFDPGEYVTAGTTAANLGTSDFTIAFWVRFDVTIPASLVSKRPRCGAAEMLDIRAIDGERAITEFAGEQASNYTLTFTTDPLNDGVWRHFAMRRTGQVVMTFIDGCLVGLGYGAGVVDFSTTAAALEFGRGACTDIDGTLPFDGAMDEIQIYARALTGFELAELALREEPGAVGDPDIDGSGTVNGADLGILLGAWGPCPGCCFADLNGDDVVDGVDIGILLGAWAG